MVFQRCRSFRFQKLQKLGFFFLFFRFQKFQKLQSLQDFLSSGFFCQQWLSLPSTTLLSRTALLQEWNSEDGSSKPWMMMLALPFRSLSRIQKDTAPCTITHRTKLLSFLFFPLQQQQPAIFSCVCVCLSLSVPKPISKDFILSWVMDLVCSSFCRILIPFYLSPSLSKVVCWRRMKMAHLAVLLFLHLAALETALTSKSSGSSDDR